MDLRLHVATTLRAAEQAATCGVVIVDQPSARAIHEAGYPLDWPGGANAVAPAALLHALRVVEPLHPRALDIRCDSELLVRQMTGGDAADEPTSNQCIEQAALLLLQLDTWRIGTLSEDERYRPTELAERAMQEATRITDLDATAAAVHYGCETTGVPQWTLELLESPGPDCPARCQAHRRYPFGPDTPAGLCVHAASAALRDGPLSWPDPEQRQMSTYCPHCEVPLRLTLVP